MAWMREAHKVIDRDESKIDWPKATRRRDGGGIVPA